MVALVICRCPGESSQRRWHLNKDLKEIVGIPGDGHSNRGRARSTKEQVRKVDAQRAEHERGMVRERGNQSGWPESAASLPAGVPWIIGVCYLISSTRLLLSALSILSISWLLPARGVLWSSIPAPDSGAQSLPQITHLLSQLA